MEIRFKPRITALSFLLAAVMLTLIHVIVSAAFLLMDSPDTFFWVRWFDLDIENNIPSAYAALSILACAVLFFIIGMLKRNQPRRENAYWIGLAVIFVYLSMDEWFQIHENIGDLVENHIPATGLLYFPWVVPYGFMVGLLALVYYRFLFGLPPDTARLMIVSGAIYLTGAMGLDMLGGREAELHGYDSITYYVLYTLEEFLEMLGIVLLIYALLSFLERYHGHLCVILTISDTVKTDDATGSPGHKARERF